MLKSMKIDDKYRILMDGEHIPEEITQSELDNALSQLKSAADNLLSMINNVSNEYNVKGDIIKRLFSNACLDSDNGGKWRIEALSYEIDMLQKYLKDSSDNVPSIEESETIYDYGYKNTWLDSEIFEKKLEDNDEREVVEEVFIKDGTFVHRKRTTEWEKVDYGRHSKSIIYEDLPIDDDLKRILENSRNFMKEL